MAMPVSVSVSGPFSRSKGSKTLRRIRSPNAFTQGVLPSQKQRQNPLNSDAKTPKGRYYMMILNVIQMLVFTPPGLTSPRSGKACTSLVIAFSGT